MSVAQTIVEKAVEWAYRHFGALQVCWICVVICLGLGWFVTSRYATASEVADLRTDLREQKGDTIAKRIFDYKVRLCDMPPDQRETKRWLAEQLRGDAEKYEKTTGHMFAMPACGDL
jgi:hypothetical protein